MQKYDYSLKTWILIAVLAVASLFVDLMIYLDIWCAGNQFMKEATVISTIIAGYILFESVRGIIKKVKEKKAGDGEKE